MKAQSRCDIAFRGILVYGGVKFTFWAFIWEEFMELAEDLAAKVNKCS